MEVERILVILCLCFLFGSTVSKKGSASQPIARGKSENFEEIYGDLAEDDIQNDDYYGGDYDENAEETNERGGVVEHVEFQTQPQTFIGNVGDTIRMPCSVSNTDVVNTWQRDETLLYHGHSPISPEKYPNIRELEVNNTLEVNISSNADFGNYACVLILSNNPKDNPRIVHRLMHPVPPIITGIVTDSNNRTEYVPGETLKMTCVASGLPKPTISWHKGSERLEVQGDTLTIPNLSESDEGTYRCLADNGLQKPSHHHIAIRISHAPRIKIGQYLVTANKEKDTELVCTVDAYPAVQPIWKKGNEILKTEENRKIITKRREQYTVESILVISNLTDEDFTNYTCTAANEMGKSEQVVSLIKIPAVREFIKPEKSYKDVVLSWKVESKSPIETHEIQYRRKGEVAWRTAVPEVVNGKDDIYTVKYILKDLDVGSYETRIRSKNEHGWSEFSEIMPFEGVLAKPGSSTHKNHHKKHHKEKELREKQDVPSAPQQQEISQKEAPVGESKPPGGSSIKTSASASILSISLIFHFYLRQ
ncbi:protein amalgam-like isoform X1 [Diorhabda carinulata]|uniref:protein amalgam-like isoform X1 n=1 Tax=Diorhabda carinulata TaxID=1163345 RepID=UPI0025A1EEC2|nr:protein amalgam-like isoform X1 [Diorhabda carinulata]